MSSSSGVRASSSTLLCPLCPGVITRDFALKRSSVWSLMPAWSGASTSSRMARYGPSSAACACAIETPGFSRPNT
jgi:hypothetical protein